MGARLIFQKKKGVFFLFLFLIAWAFPVIYNDGS